LCAQANANAFRPAPPLGPGNMQALARRGVSALAAKMAPYVEHVAPVAQGPKLLGGPACWTGQQLVAHPSWGQKLDDSELESLTRAVATAKEHGAFVCEGVPEGVFRETFPLTPKLKARIAVLSEEIENGLGCAMIDNMPVGEHSIDDMAIMYAGVCSHIGNLVQQSSAGLRSKSRGYGVTMGLIKAEMRGKTPKDGMQANNYFRLHTDRCDVISLLSIRTASAGGEGRVASAIAIHDEMLKRAPHLVPHLYRPIERIWEAGVIALPIWSTHPETGKFTTQISPSYIENAQYVNGVRRLTAEEIEAIDLIEEIGLEIGHSFLQQPGQMTFLNNHMVYHGRTAWRHTDSADGESSRDDTENGRLLMRTWISPYNSRELPDTPEMRTLWGNIRAGEPRGGLAPAVASGLTEKPPELIQAYSSGAADYYGLYKRKFSGEDVNI